MVRAVKKLKAGSNPKTMFFCLSNANSIFISTILKVHIGEFLRKYMLTYPSLVQGS